MKNVWKATFVNALVLFSVGSVAAFLFSSSMIEIRFVTSYWLGITAQSGLTLIVSAGIAAVGGAIEGARLRSLRTNTFPRTRSSIQITLRVLAPVLIAAVLIQLVSFLILSRYSPGAADAPNFALLLVFLLVIFFHLLLGFNLGLRIHPALAIPIALTASYIWLGASWGVNFYPLRYMAGLILMDCCRIYEQLEPNAVYAALTFNGVGALASFLFATRKIRGKSKSNILLGLTAGTVAATAVGLSILVSSELGPVPITNRDSASMICSDSQFKQYRLSAISSTDSFEDSVNPYICFFEAQDPTGEFDSALRITWARLNDLGIEPPKLIVGTNQQNTGQRVGVVATPVSRPEEVSYSLVVDIIGQPAICDELSDQEWANRDFTYRALIKFLLTSASSAQYDLSGFAPPLSEIEQATYENLRKWSIEFLKTDVLGQDSLRWLILARQSVQSCSVQPPEMP